MEYKDTNYDGDPTVADELRHATRVRHATPEALAEATALPADQVNRHLAGEAVPSPPEITRYSAALGLSEEKLLTKCGLDGKAAAERDQSAVLAAVHRLLDDVWPSAPVEEREQIIAYLRRLRR